MNLKTILSSLILTVSTVSHAQVTYTPIGESPLVAGQGVTGLAISSSGTAYISVTNTNTDGNLHTIDLASGTTALIGAFGAPVRDLALDPTSGILYGACKEGNDNNWLCSIDTGTGALTTIGAMGFISNYASLTFADDGTLYYVRTNNQGGGTIDLATGLATELWVPEDASATRYGSTALGWFNNALLGHDCCDKGVGGQDFISIDTATGVATNLGAPQGTQQIHDIAVYNGVVYAVTGGTNQGLDDGGTFGWLDLGSTPAPVAPSGPAEPVPALPLGSLWILGALAVLIGIRQLRPATS